jgi:hypothetical protein
MRHPFAGEPIKKKYAYMIGIVIAALEKGEIKEKQEAYLKGLADMIELSNDDLEKIIQVGNQYQNLKEDIISVLDTSYKKYCFLTDLYQMLYEKESTMEDFIEDARYFEKKLCITEDELKEIQQIYNLQVYEKEVLSQRTKVFLEYEPPSQEKEAFLEESSLVEEKVEKKILEMEERKETQQKTECIIADGESLCIEGDYFLTQNIYVLKGGKLVFREANVEVFKGNIIVEEGELYIDNSSFKVQEEIGTPLFHVMESSIKIMTSNFDANRKAHLWVQTGGFLEACECTFQNTVEKSAVMIWDCPSHFKQTIFKRCKASETAGGAVYTNSNIAFEGCQFIECEAYKGAAIFRFASTIVWASLKGEKTTKEPFINLFGQKVDFIPIPKQLSSIPYPLILKDNRFYKCKPIKEGVVCAYKEQVILQQNNVFEKCSRSKIAYYE